MNKVILSGNLTRDPEVRYTQSGKAVASFSIGVSRRFSRDNQDGTPTADFISIVAWERLAEFCGNYLVKGSKILVEGRLQARSYDAKDGTKRYVTEVVANEIEFAGAKPQQGGSYGQQGGYQQNAGGYGAQPSPQVGAAGQGGGANSFGPIPDDEIPF